jgi:hypothetical protein
VSLGLARVCGVWLQYLRDNVQPYEAQCELGVRTRVLAIANAKVVSGPSL